MSEGTVVAIGSRYVARCHGYRSGRRAYDVTLVLHLTRREVTKLFAAMKRGDRVRLAACGAKAKGQSR